MRLKLQQWWQNWFEGKSFVDDCRKISLAPFVIRFCNLMIETISIWQASSYSNLWLCSLPIHTHIYIPLRQTVAIIHATRKWLKIDRIFKQTMHFTFCIKFPWDVVTLAPSKQLCNLWSTANPETVIRTHSQKLGTLAPDPTIGAYPWDQLHTRNLQLEDTLPPSIVIKGSWR